jgi:hypothetical protein
MLKDVGWDQALLVASEGKDPSYIIDAEEKSLTQLRIGYIKTYGPDELYILRKIKKDHGDSVPELMLLAAEPTPAVLDELRKIYSQRAWVAKKENDWQSVIDNLDKYNSLAKQHREYCLKLVRQAPPEHTDRDKKLREKAKEELSTV